jgi:outer membrane protein
MKLPIINLFALLLACTMQFAALAQNKAVTTTLSLKQAQDYAIKNNAGSRNAVLDMEIARKKIWETKAMGMPQVNAQANYQHLFKVPEMSLGGITVLKSDLPDGAPVMSEDIGNGVYLGYQAMPPIQLGVKNNTTLDITVSQLIFSGEYIVGLQATKIFYLMSEQKKAKTEIDLKEFVANWYATALLLERNLDVMKKSLDNTKKTLSDMQQMYKQGLIENTDVDQLEFASLSLTNGVNSMSRQLDYTMDVMKFQLGMPFDENIILTDQLESIADNINLETIVASQFNINNNLDYQILANSEAISRLNLRREQSTFLPNLAAVYRHSEKMKKPEFDFNPKDVFQISMNIPIFSSGMRNVKVQQRELELQQVINTRNNAANGLQLENMNARNNISTAYEKYVNDKRNIELTKRIYDKTLIRFNEGLASSKDISDNLAQYLNAQSSLYSSIFSLISAKNKLDKLNNNL